LAAHIHIEGYFIVFAEYGCVFLQAQGIDKMLEHVITLLAFSYSIPMDKAGIISGGFKAILIAPVPIPNAGEFLGFKPGEIAYTGVAIREQMLS
jgi:hypothetical protein